MNRTPHLNRAQVRRTALELAARHRAHRFTRVSASFLERIEAAALGAIMREIRLHPSVGRTLK